MAAADGTGPAPGRHVRRRRRATVGAAAFGLAALTGVVGGGTAWSQSAAGDAAPVTTASPTTGPTPGAFPVAASPVTVAPTVAELAVEGPHPFTATYTIDAPVRVADRLHVGAVAGTPELGLCLQLAGAVTNGSLVARRPGGEVETYRLLGTWHPHRNQLTAAFGSGRDGAGADGEIGTLTLTLR